MIVFTIAPANPTTGSAMILFTFSFDKRIQSHPAATPIKILHPTEIQTALTAPGIPVVLINGENANDKSVGAIVLLINEQIPNTPPRIAPVAGPNKIAPIITGMCTVVALMIGSCIIPSGVFARTITIAAISATLTIQLVLCFLSSCLIFLLVIIPGIRDTIQLRIRL